VSLGIGALSYAGTFNISVIADRDAYPDTDVFATAVRHELDTLAACVRVVLPVASVSPTRTPPSIDNPATRDGTGLPWHALQRRKAAPADRRRGQTDGA